LLKITTLGYLSIQVDDKPIRFISHKVDALLVYLVCEPREHPREKLAELLWTETSQERAMANLRMALSSLQSQLGPYINANRYTVSINPEMPVWLDIATMRSELNAAQNFQARRGRLSGIRATQLEQSLSLFYGDFLAGFYLRGSKGFEEWMLAEQEQIREHVLSVSRHLIENMVQHQKYSQGINLTQRMLEFNTLDETFNYQLIGLLALSGQRNRALQHYQAYCDALDEQLGIAPDARIASLYQRIVDEESADTEFHSPPHDTLPNFITHFVARPELMDRLLYTLDNPDCHLLTLVGSGGAGKTRLAIEAARSCIYDYPDGVYFIPLESITNAALIAVQFANALKINLHSAESVQEQVLNFLRNRELLLVVDNVEHLLEGVPFLGDILRAAPLTRILVTSRTRLNVQGEWLLPIEGLRFPVREAPGMSEEYEAIHLFVQNAQQIQPDFSIHEYMASVIRICQLLDGLPLAIELAASWLHLISPDEIVHQIEQNIEILSTPSQDVPDRHRSIRTIFEHSWQMLIAQERDVFMRLSVFEGGFTASAAEHVAGGTLQILLRLSEKSLVRGDVGQRFMIHDLTRRFAEEKLVEAGLETAVQDAYIEYYLQYVRDAEHDLIGARQAEKLNEIEADIHNVRRVLMWTSSRQRPGDALSLVVSLEQFWRIRGYETEGRCWLTRYLRLYEVADSVRAKALAVLSLLAQSQGDYADSERLLEECLALSNDLALSSLVSKALLGLSIAVWARGNHQEAFRYGEACVAIALTEQDQQRAAQAMNHMAIIHRAQGNYARAQSLLTDTLAVYRQINDQRMIISCLNNLGNVAYCLQNFDLARTWFDQCLEAAREVGNRRGIALALAGMTAILVEQGEYDEASSNAQQAVQIARELGDKFISTHLIGAMARIEQRRGNLDQAEELYMTCFEQAKHVNQVSLTWMLEGIAYTAVSKRKFKRAAQLLGAADALRETLKATIPPSEMPYHRLQLHTVRQALGDAAFIEAVSQGRDLHLDTVLANIMSENLAAVTVPQLSYLPAP
jgi:predicted ATPase/DNA-binding SARP family transcriptional activator